MVQNNVTEFGGVGEVRMLHIAEILVAMNQDMFMHGEWFKARTAIQSPDGSRVIMFPPTIEKAVTMPASASMDDRALALLYTESEDSESKLSSIPKHVEKNGVTSIVPESGRNMMSVFTAFSAMFVQRAAFQEALKAIAEQHPVLRECDLNDLDSKFFEIYHLEDEGGAQTDIDKLKTEAVKILKSKVDDSRTRYFGSEWVKIKVDHTLTAKIQAAVDNTKGRLGVSEPPPQKP